MSTSEGTGTEHADDAAPEAADAVTELTVLDDLDGRPLHEHVTVYDELHARLQGALNRIDEA